MIDPCAVPDINSSYDNTYLHDKTVEMDEQCEVDTNDVDLVNYNHIRNLNDSSETETEPTDTSAAYAYDSYSFSSDLDSLGSQVKETDFSSQLEQMSNPKGPSDSELDIFSSSGQLDPDDLLIPTSDDNYHLEQGDSSTSSSSASSAGASEAGSSRPRSAVSGLLPSNYSDQCSLASLVLLFSIFSHHFNTYYYLYLQLLCFFNFSDWFIISNFTLIIDKLWSTLWLPLVLLLSIITIASYHYKHYYNHLHQHHIHHHHHSVKISLLLLLMSLAGHT